MSSFTLYPGVLTEWIFLFVCLFFCFVCFLTLWSKDLTRSSGEWHNDSHLSKGGAPERLRYTCIYDHMVTVCSLLNGWKEAVYLFQVPSFPICCVCCIGKIMAFMENIMIHPHTVKTVRMTFSFHKHLPPEMLSTCVLPSWRNKHCFPLYLFRYF